MRQRNVRACMRTLPFLAWLIACGGSTEPRVDDSRCHHTGEFDNSGCTVVVGLVTDSTGRPVEGAYVGIRGAVDSLRLLATDVYYFHTDASGRYQIHVTRFSPPLSATEPDTISVWVGAAVPPPVVAAGAPGIGARTVALLHWQPISAVPDTTHVPDIALPLAAR